VPHLHFRRTVHKSGGKQASARVRYITRETEREPASQAERQLRYVAREGREDLVYTRSRNLPGWAQGSPQTYFRAAEQYEWARGNAFEEWKITLPQELSPRQNMDLMRDLVTTIAGERLPITYAFHSPQTMDGTQAQPHLHLLISGRQEDGIMRTPAQHFKKYNRTHPERGGAPKDPALYHYRAVKGWRVTISDVINVHLERAGREERLHPDRLEDQEIPRRPEPKLLPSQSRAYREQGTVSETMQEVLTIRAERQQTRATEQAKAREYWEERKSALGITEDMDLPAQLAVIGAARALVREQAAPRPVAQHDAGVEQDERVLGDLAREASTQTQAEAQTLWVGVQDLADAWQLGHMGQKSVQQARTIGRALWRDAQDEQRLRDVGSEAADDAWRDAVLLWAEEQGARALRNMGWDAVQDAREEGQEAIAAAVHERWRAEQARTWTSLEEDLQALARQLDDLSSEEGGHGHVRIRLWEREREQGLGL
jgi:MobA/MobL family